MPTRELWDQKLPDPDPGRTALYRAYDEATQRPFGLIDLADDSLVRVARQLRRRVEDGEPGAKFAKQLRAIKVQQLSRLALRMRYGAVDNHVGTDVYDRYHRLDEPPTYNLAAHMDRERARLGWRHVLAWPPEELSGRWLWRSPEQQAEEGSSSEC